MIIFFNFIIFTEKMLLFQRKLLPLQKFRCLLIVYRRTIREFINMVRINRIEAYSREIPVLKVLGLNPNGITS